MPCQHQLSTDSFDVDPRSLTWRFHVGNRLLSGPGIFISDDSYNTTGKEERKKKKKLPAGSHSNFPK